MKGRLLLSLPHRQFVFTFPKLLRPYSRHNRRLFSDISRLIFVIIKRFYDKAAGRTGMVLAYQSAGEYLKFNPHYHCIVLEGGFDERGRFVHIPLGNLQRMTEYFRRLIIKFFLNKQLINATLATSLINWKHSGFSIDHSIRIPAFSIKSGMRAFPGNGKPRDVELAHLRKELAEVKEERDIPRKAVAIFSRPQK